MHLKKIDFKRKQTPVHYNELQLTGDLYFTPREVTVLACLTSGKSSNHMGSILDLTPSTIDNIIYKIHKKLKIHSRYELITFIEQSGQYDNFRSYYIFLCKKKKESSDT